MTSTELIPVGLSAGHGGWHRNGRRNNGRVHRESGLVESELTLSVTCSAAAQLDKSSLVEPIPIRVGHTGLTHNERNKIAERAGCQALVEIHFNSSENKDRHGGELYHRPGDSVGRALGVEILGAIPTRDWRIWTSDYRYKGKIASPGAYNVTHAYSMPCALVELAFLSNISDRAWLLRKGTIDSLASAVAVGVQTWAILHKKETVCSP